MLPLCTSVRDVLVAGLAERRAQVGHRDPVARAEVDPAQERDLPCHDRGTVPCRRDARTRGPGLRPRRAAAPRPRAMLEIGAGDGELAAALREDRYEVHRDRPQGRGRHRRRAHRADRRRGGRYDAAIAVVSLHHVEPLAESCARLAELIEPGGVLAIDELDIRPLRRARDRLVAAPAPRGRPRRRPHAPRASSTACAAHIHPLDAVLAALAPHFTLGEPVRGPYLHRWHLPPGLRETEERLIGCRRLPATGARLVGIRGGAGIDTRRAAAWPPAEQRNAVSR